MFILVVSFILKHFAILCFYVYLQERLWYMIGRKRKCIIIMLYYFVTVSPVLMCYLCFITIKHEFLNLFFFFISSLWTYMLYRHVSIVAHRSSVSAFTCKSRGLWFESYTGLIWISLGTRNESLRLQSTKVWIGSLRGHCLCMFDITWCCIFGWVTFPVFYKWNHWREKG